MPKSNHAYGGIKTELDALRALADVVEGACIQAEGKPWNLTGRLWQEQVDIVRRIQGVPTRAERKALEEEQQAAMAQSAGEVPETAPPKKRKRGGS